MFEVEFTRVAEHDLSRLDRTVAQEVLNRLQWLAQNVGTVRHRALTAQMRGAFSLRIGQYRAVYTLHRTERRLVVHIVRHRSKVYRLR